MRHEEIGKNLTEGNILRLVITFSLPLFIGNILQLLQQTINAFWIGRFLGKDALSAVTVSFPIIFVLISIIIGLTLATTTLVSQYRGAGNFEMVDKVIKNSFVFILLVGIIVSLLGIIFNRSILGILLNYETAPHVFEMASGYLVVSFLGLIFMFGYNLISAILRGLGDSWTPLWFLMIATILNAVLDPFLILGFSIVQGLGINGSALATIIAQFLSFTLGIRFLLVKGYLTTLKFWNFKFDGNLISRLLKIGLPSAIQQTIVSTGSFIITAIVSLFGVDTITAYGIGTRVDSFSFMPATALGMAVTALSGQNLGAGKKARVHKTVKVAGLLSVSIAILIILVCFLFPVQIIHFFLGTTSEELLKQAVMYLRIVPIGYLGISMLFITNGVLMGAGYTVPPMIFSILSFWVFRIPLAWILSQYTSLRTTGIWLAITISFIFSAGISYLYYRFGRWEKKVAIKRWKWI